MTNEKQSRLEIFDEARKYFVKRLEEESVQSTGDADEGRYFLIASIATSTLYAIGKEKLLDLEKQGIVHNSTISGSSLGLAAKTINDYLDGRLELRRDNAEQLYRTCQSAKKVCEINYQ